MRSCIKEYQLVVVVVAALCVWLLWELRYVAAVLFGGYIIASATLPMVDFAARHRVPRVVAVVSVALGLVACLALVGTIATVRFTTLANIGPALGSQLQSIASTASSFGIDISAVDTWISSHAAAFATVTVSAAAGLLAAFVVGMYLVYDWPRLLPRLAGATSNAGLARRVIQSQVSGLGAWTLGQLALSAIVGFAVYVLLAVIGFPYAATLGLLAGVFELVPYAGPILAALPAVFLAWRMGLSETLLVLAIYVVVQQAENHLLVPLVMRRAVYIHPVVVIGVILVGFESMGVAGALFAVPLTSVVWTTYKELRAAPVGDTR